MTSAVPADDLAQHRVAGAVAVPAAAATAGRHARWAQRGHGEGIGLPTGHSGTAAHLGRARLGMPAAWLHRCDAALIRRAKVQRRRRCCRDWRLGAGPREEGLQLGLRAVDLEVQLGRLRGDAGEVLVHGRHMLLEVLHAHAHRLGEDGVLLLARGLLDLQELVVEVLDGRDQDTALLGRSPWSFSR